MGLLITGAGGSGKGGDKVGTLFWIENEGDETVTVSLKKNKSTAPTVTLEKSADGSTWEAWGSTSTTALTAEIPVGGRLYLQGENECFSDMTDYNFFAFSGPVSVHGNIYALLHTYEVEDDASCFYNLFYGCTTITDVNIYCREYSACMFSSCTGLTEINIPKTSEYININVFVDCTGLTEVKIPNGVTRIKECAFVGCTCLVSVKIPNSVRTVDGAAFKSCVALTEVNLPGVRTLGTGAFIGCEALVNVTLGDAVEEIGDEVFINNISLETVTINTVIPPAIGQAVFAYCGELHAIYVPSHSVDAYKAAAGWGEFANIIMAIQ